MSTFYLVRHGLRASRNEDTLLSDVGAKQAELTGRYFQSKNIQHIFVSPLKRTLHTAEIINGYLQISHSTDSRLKERMEYDPSFGTFEAFLKEWGETMADREYQPPYGDSALQAGKRIVSLFDELNDDDKNYLFISHGGVIGDAVRNLFPDSALSLTTDLSKNLRWLDVSECSITEIQKVDHFYSLKRVGDTSHLV